MVCVDAREHHAVAPPWGRNFARRNLIGEGYVQAHGRVQFAEP
jgi:hypothetical protein